VKEGAVDRREAASRLAALALAPALALAWQAPLAATTQLRPAPQGAFRLTRVLRRGLADGAAIIVTRQWQVSFAPQGRGLVVAGSQLSAEVAAPPALAALAALEQRRQPASLFPLVLDGGGRIALAAGNGDDAALSTAVATARRLIGAKAGAARAVEASAFLNELTQTAAALVSRLPDDLFFPDPEPLTRSEAIALPEGGTGLIEIARVAERAAGGLLRTCQRVVTTRIAEDSRTATETWSLAPIP
jgi:hypothetical protein